MPTREEISRAEAERLGLNRGLGYFMGKDAPVIWDALIDAKMELAEREQGRAEAFNEAMGAIDMPPDGHVGYDEWLFNRGWYAGRADSETKLERLRDALQQIDDMLDGGLPITHQVKSIARAVLSNVKGE